MMKLHHANVLPALLIALLATAAPASAAKERVDLLQSSAEAKKLIVRIHGENVEGSGIIFAVEGTQIYGFTAKHVLVSRGKVITGLRARLKLWTQDLPIEGERFHNKQDLATFRIDASSLGLSAAQLQQAIPLNQLGGTRNLDPGNAINTIGHAAGGAWIDSKTPGRFIEMETFANPGERDTLKLEHFCPPGHSGGGIFDDQWHLIGMIFDNQEPFCRGLRIETILSILNDWKYTVKLQPAARQEKVPTKQKTITVAVLDFDNRSGASLPEIGSAACDIVTSFLFNMPWLTVVTRERLDTILREQQLNPTRLSTEGVSRVGHLVDADAIVTGSVTRYDVERRTYNGYGTTILSDTYRMSINLQVIDIDSGIVRFSKEFTTENTKAYPDARSAPQKPLSREAELLQGLLVSQASEGVQQALREIGSGVDRAGKLISIPISTTPAGAEITINNIYYGKTPTRLDLSVGVHEIELRLPGYAPWRHRVNVVPGAGIEVVLSPQAQGP